MRRTQFEVAVATADAYLTLVVAQETVRAAQAGADRAGVVMRITNALVNSPPAREPTLREPMPNWPRHAHN